MQRHPGLSHHDRVLEVLYKEPINFSSSEEQEEQVKYIKVRIGTIEISVKYQILKYIKVRGLAEVHGMPHH